MRRKLTIAMLLSLSASSLQALALGVGEAAVSSSLNAPLRATIPLTDTSGLEPELLRVSVAEPREFESAGLIRSPLAASVRTSVRVRDGQLMVDLITERAVREPWLDLMLSFEWPGGRQLREVTLLLDPPDYDQLPVLVGLPPRQPSSTAERSTTEPVQEAPAQPVTQSRDTQSGDPAWVSSGDTLWAVAGRLRPDSGISMDQMMVALVEANPDVFPSGNINAMRAGHTLVVPSRDAIVARSSQQAGDVVQAMNQAWASRGSGSPARVPLGTAEVAIAAPAAAQAAELADTAGEPEPASGSGESANGLVAGVEETAEPRLTLLSDAELAAEAAGSPNQPAEDGAGGGETDASGLSEAGQSPESRLDPDVLASLDAEALAPQSESQRLESLERRWLESRSELEAVQAERDALQEELGDLRSEVNAMRDQLAALVAGGQGVDAPGGGGMVPPGGQSFEAETPWWGAVYQDGLDRQLMLGGAGLAALLGLWLLIRRRRSRETASTKSFANMPNVTYGAPTESVSMPPASSTTPPVVTGMSVASADEAVERPAPMPQAEAISEADIFMAYGRYDQARESLLAGLAREPERDDLRLKLLTVHVEQGDWPSAEREAERLAEGGDPSMVAEASRLMAAHRAAASGGDDERGRVPAEFVAARELPPQEFDSLLEPHGGEVEKRDEVEKDDEVDEVEKGGEAETQLPRFEAVKPSDSDDAEAQSGEPEPPPLDDTDKRAILTPAADSAHAGESSTMDWDMIDYQPPALDPEPGRREETPMQPSIDFPTTGAGKGEVADVVDGDGSRDAPENAQFLGEASLGERPRPEEDEWEVEEVAFPPLERDNEGASDSVAGFDELEEARRLLGVGETDRAYALLQRLRDSAADPRIQTQAKELITHYRL
ncbi:hypothetical protein KZO25_02705 [Halomonas sp. ANAO-440]|uniref:type IV pilus assembly protein FimV n=1 Tax=Halomonas sp. ANAO-440 TaxID=2861360 RepID=UPI001CAA7895|nr:FimV/HubP family polar landmark protein [Halomonas sp. ANAO-440]MBZ0329226.1 hypothetical protein [Halomonas sp. ANAO-440]